MSTINELYLQIEDLNKKIEDESRKRLKRKLVIKDEIKKLEEEKRRSGLHGDFQSVQKFNTQIKRLQHESTGENIYEYESEIKATKHKILNIILDYYEKGQNIEDILKIEDVPQDIQDEWLNKCNFGKTTGFLFVDEIDDEDYYWRYYNPIFDIEYKSRTFDELKNQIILHNEVYLIFNNDLANKSKNRDSKLYQYEINKKLDKLDKITFSYRNARIILEDLSNYADKFSNEQLVRLCHISITNDQVYKCIYCETSLRNILSVNKDRINSELYEEVFLKNEL